MSTVQSNLRSSQAKCLHLSTLSVYNRNSQVNKIVVWPFGDTHVIQPRGLRNLRLDGIFPDEDYQNAKRFVGLIKKGVPNITDVLPSIAQEGSKHKLKKLLHKSTRKKSDKLETTKQTGRTRANFDHNQSKTSESFINAIEAEKEFDNTPGARFTPIFYVSNSRTGKLFPLLGGKGCTKEFTANINKWRKNRQLSLSTTDITNFNKIIGFKEEQKICHETSYLKQIVCQMNTKRQQLQNLIKEEREKERHHFVTWDSFWGRPGNGAPSMQSNKKHKLNSLLFPQKI